MAAHDRQDDVFAGARRCVGGRVIRCAALAVALGAVMAGQTRAADDEAWAIREQRMAIKRLQADLVVEPARREWQERRERLRELGRKRRTPGARSRAEPISSLPARRAPLLVDPRNPVALSANVRVNPAPGFWTQSEVTLAAIGRSLVAAWNDGAPLGGTSSIACASSTNGGDTWRAVPPLPTGGVIVSWESDPVLVADPVRGEFWFAALAIASSPPANAIGVLHGAFTDTGFVWLDVGIARATRDTLPDKPWLAIDPATGELALSYTLFYRIGRRLTDRIEFQRSGDGGRSWTPPSIVSPSEEAGLVQGSRPAFGPDGEMHVVWALVDTSDGGRGLDHIRLRTSRDGGRSFGATVDVARVVTNFASGAPGYNRPYAINFPAIAVDRGESRYRGRVYVGWMESADFYSQFLGAGLPVVEGDGEGGTPFAIGDLLRGSREPSDRPDLYRFRARRGQTAMFMIDSLAPKLDAALGVGCDSNPFELAYSDPPGFGRVRVTLATFPRDGEYVFAVAQGNAERGAYRVRTGWLQPGRTRGRDVRDVFVAHSDDGATWSRPARVSDAPPWFDDWLPELAVGPTGNAYVAWYDWRDSPADRCGARSNIHLSRSLDGGASWQRLGVLSDRASDWGATTSNLVPNQGDYIALVADTSGIYAAWADARGESPDVFFARFEPAREPSRPAPVRGVSLSSLQPNPSHGGVDVRYAATPGIPARFELWDVAGRRVQEQTIDSPVASGGARFTARAGLPAGVYLLRLVQGSASASARLAIIP